MDHEYIKGCTLFCGISDDDIGKLLECINYRRCSYRKGAVMIPESLPADSIGVILRGAVTIVKEDIRGSRTAIAVLGKNELFGENAASGRPESRTLTYTASEDSDILFAELESILHTCSRSCPYHRQLSVNLIRMLTEKNRMLMEKLEIISKRTLREKILAYLSSVSERSGKDYFEIPLGRVALAEYLCADRSALTRELSNMRNDGLIDFDKNTFRMINKGSTD
ncbi:MAG: Crp/Fnr family transcriptional regulator [Oscillospiraceae bacterium]|nr:Crp/Fnr family transcriptional regulator [Oscillospiraceae bacterium]